MDRYGEICTTYQMILDGAFNRATTKCYHPSQWDSPLFNSVTTINPTVTSWFYADWRKVSLELARWIQKASLARIVTTILTLQDASPMLILRLAICPPLQIFKRPDFGLPADRASEITNTSTYLSIDGQPTRDTIGGSHAISGIML